MLKSWPPLTIRRFYRLNDQKDCVKKIPGEEMIGHVCGICLHQPEILYFTPNLLTSAQ